MSRTSSVIGAVIGFTLSWIDPTHGHEIYTGLHGRTGNLCCGGSDCSVTTYRERGSRTETAKSPGCPCPGPDSYSCPIPGDDMSDARLGRAHLCYTTMSGYQSIMPDKTQIDDHGVATTVFCAFIPPGAI